jgi:2-polyprenyl-6-hydroxyphenyl methylase / 3-demethylubiquinone-9 3-methyltransferase
MNSTIDQAEIDRFAAIADEWWQPGGPFSALHKLNPVRIAYIRDALCSTFGRNPTAPQPLLGLRLLDVGCGGGLLCEPLARLGATVTGIDAAAAGIAVARAHAEAHGLAIDYRATTAEALHATGLRFDAVLAMEVIEHVADPALFIATLAELTKPGGILCMASMNRTPQSWLLGIVAAERIVRWVPVGTHEWRRFPRPSELAAALRHQGMRLRDLSGVRYDLWRDRFVLDAGDLSVNYMLHATKDGAGEGDAL